MQIYLGARFFCVCLYSVDLNNLEQLSLSRLPFNCDREALPNLQQTLAFPAKYHVTVCVNRFVLHNVFFYANWI